jgi:hypothetical protein
MGGFIVLDNKKYLIGLDFTPRREPSRSVQVSITGKTLTQTFEYVDQTWDMTILVDLYQQSPDYGCREDLLAAWAKDYVTFTDPLGMQQGNVFIVNNLEEQLKYAIIDETSKFEVKLSLRLRQV